MSALTKYSFKRHLSSNEFFNIYFIYGEDKYSIKLCTKALVNKICGDTSSDFDFNSFDGDELNIDLLADFAYTYPVMSKFKCVLLKDIDIELLSKIDLGKLRELLSDLPKETIFIISQQLININLKKSLAWRNFIKFIENKGCVLEIPYMSESELKKEIVRHAEKLNCKISLKNAEKLMKDCSEDISVLLSETEKLCALKTDSEITYSDIDKYSIKSFQTTVFILARAVISGNIDNAFLNLEILLQNKEQPIAIIAVLSSAYIDIYRAKFAQKRGLNLERVLSTFSSEYKGREFKLKNAQKECAKISESQIIQAINLLIKTDEELKRTSMDKRLLIQELIVKLALISKGDC